MIEQQTWTPEIKAAMLDPVHSLNASPDRASEGSDYRSANAPVGPDRHTVGSLGDI